MSDKIVDLKPRGAERPAVRPAEVWHCQVNLRLTRIERMLRRLEWQIWVMLCGGCVLIGSGLVDWLAGH
ncbi:hypothetical protein EU805_06550 [Salipiger sp. IMCC34102]|uniref:hypothetical protein n=1 Tax=Salipiger sp. IMCC34102 TaxID=2510647 RepID=UPI00101CE284|nr:hypothetical protein [Salipiger sp. IMCC34102]RYH03379.1 hypothetical protein EU805_06550 [Salipiger sp. IMCC34102]